MQNLFHQYCSIITVPPLLFHHHCSSMPVPPLLFHHDCSTITVFHYCSSITDPSSLFHFSTITVFPPLFHQVNYLARITSVSRKFMRKLGQEQKRKKEVQARRREEKQMRASVFFFPLPSPFSQYCFLLSRGSQMQGFLRPGF